MCWVHGERFYGIDCILEETESYEARVAVPTRVRVGPGADYEENYMDLDAGREVTVKGKIGDWLRLKVLRGDSALLFVQASKLEEAVAVVRSPKCAEIWAEGNPEYISNIGVKIPCWQEVDERPGCYVLRTPGDYHFKGLSYWGGADAARYAYLKDSFGGEQQWNRFTNPDKVHLSGEGCSGTLTIESYGGRLGGYAFRVWYSIEVPVVDGVPNGHWVTKVWDGGGGGGGGDSLMFLNQGPVVDGKAHGRWVRKYVGDNECVAQEFRHGDTYGKRYDVDC